MKNLSIEKIKGHLSSSINEIIEITLLEETGSTNDDMKNIARRGDAQGNVIIAKRQTAGKGRLGRSFFSPEGTGLYMSILLRPELSPFEATLLTPMAAVATAKAIEELTGKITEIKWVNDILISGKKVSGILTESGIIGNKTEFAVIGIGVNLVEPKGGFPDEIREIAGAVTCEGADISFLAAKIINNVFYYYEKLEEKAFFEEYRKRLSLLGKEISVHSGNEVYNALAEDIDEMCRLIVRDENGKKEILACSEVSVRI